MRGASPQTVVATVVGLVAWLAVARLAFADGEPAPNSPVRFHVGYSAHDGCPSEADFRRGVESRALSAEATDAAPGNVGIAVTLTREGEGTAGLLVVTLPEGTSSERRVKDASCSAAADSLAVMSALSLDALLIAPPGTAEPPASSPIAPAPAGNIPSETPIAASPERPGGQPGRQGADRGFEVRLRASALWETAAAPHLPVGARAGVEAASRRDGPFAPSGAVEAIVTFGGSITTTAGSAEFHLVAARLSACPVRLMTVAGGFLRPCLELDAGALRGTPDETVPNGVTQTMPWLAGGAGVDALLPLGPRWSLSASVAGRGLLRHDVFVFRPDFLVYDVPPVSFGVCLGLSYRL